MDLIYLGFVKLSREFAKQIQPVHKSSYSRDFRSLCQTSESLVLPEISDLEVRKTFKRQRYQNLLDLKTC
jgi:hypothetical protein